MKISEKRRGRIFFWTGIVLAVVLISSGSWAVKKTSEDDFCAACHIHPQATQTWMQSTHVNNMRGIRIHCVDCHLPPHGEGYLVEKAKTGMRDVWGKLFKDPESFDWDAKSQIVQAAHHTYEASCTYCHANNFPLGLSTEGREAHLYYEQNTEDVRCINCHITVGHYDPTRIHAANVDFGLTSSDPGEIYTEPAVVEEFIDFTEYIPGTPVSFEMKAIPGGTFMMGSPEDEPFRLSDEGPVREVAISPFFMGMAEVSWDEFTAFYSSTGTGSRTTDSDVTVPMEELDASSGPTPPYGNPDQGWGTGQRPVITIRYHAAEVYCRWLSEITGKTYRLPTEAEWEYAARGGTSGPYFFEGDPKRFVDEGIRNRIFGVDTATINTYAIYLENSLARTHPPGLTKPNPFGLVNMLGNVAEFCSDWYAPDTYASYPDGVVMDPTGPESGAEHVIRGGAYLSDARSLRSAARDFTLTEDWMRTDPQIPQSIWWYSDCTHVGFRVVCEFENN
jgi:formylglycine-generating enzyme required for sulfatase activity/nitrate/TMAO reductase-like tetraheme cytochrome c subunit